MPSTAPLFDLDQVSLHIKGRVILEKLTFQIAANPSVITIIGPNGAGKSTLLKLFAGLYQPTNGTLQCSVAKNIGYMPQQLDVHPYLPLRVEDFLNLTPYVQEDGVALLRRLYGKQKGDTHIPLEKRRMHDLSTGAQQQVLFAKVLMRRPSVLLLDEPTRGLDLAHEHLFYEHVRALRKKGCTVVMASHDLHMVFKESDRVISLNKSICCMGKPADVKAYEKERNQKQTTHSALQDMAPYHHIHHRG